MTVKVFHSSNISLHTILAITTVPPMTIHQAIPDRAEPHHHPQQLLLHGLGGQGGDGVGAGGALATSQDAQPWHVNLGGKGQ